MSPKARTRGAPVWAMACAIAAVLLLVLAPREAAAEDDHDDEIYEDPPPRLLNEIAKALFNADPRVDGDTIVGLHVAASLGQGVPPFGDGEAFGLDGLEENVFSQGYGSLHLRTHLGIGFGSNRIYGISEQTLDAGIRLPIGTLPIGLYARLGIDAGAYGDSRLYTSRLTLPYGRIGLQWQGKSSMVELGAAGGAVLMGRFDVGDDGVRSLSGTSEIGPTVLVTTHTLMLSGELRRLGAESTGTGEPVVLARATACGALRGFGIGLCMQASYGTGDVLRRDERLQVQASSFFGGMTVGYLAE